MASPRKRKSPPTLSAAVRANLKPRKGLAPRTCADSRTDMIEVVLPNDANIHCAALGGRVMHWIDMCAAIAAMRFTGRPMVTASVDELHFLGPVRLGEMAVLKGEVTQAWRSSVEVEVHVEAEDMLQGLRRPTTAAFLTFVAVDEEGKPSQVPPIELKTPAERKRAREADVRRERRLESRRKIRSERGLEG